MTAARICTPDRQTTCPCYLTRSNMRPVLLETMFCHDKQDPCWPVRHSESHCFDPTQEFTAGHGECMPCALNIFFLQPQACPACHVLAERRASLAASETASSASCAAPSTSENVVATMTARGPLSSSGTGSPSFKPASRKHDSMTCLFSALF